MIVNLTLIVPNKIMQAVLKLYGNNCPHMQKVPYPIHNAILNTKQIVLFPPSTIIWIILLTIHALCMPLSLYITCLWTLITPSSYNKIFNTIMSSSHSTTSNTYSINVNSGDHLVVTTLYTQMGVCTLLIWPMSDISAHKPSLIPLDHLLTDKPMVDRLALMSACLNTLNDMQTLWELARHQ